jgi:hypothetical protein
MENGKRSFTIEKCQKVKCDGGRYLSTTPGAAARKAARQIFAEHKVSGSVKFMLRETTEGSNKKEYCYSAQKKTLNPPKVVKIGKSEVVYKHEYVVKACTAF